MARNPIVFSNGTLVSNAKVNVEGTIYDVEPAQYEGSTPLSASNLNQLQTNLYDYIEEYADNKIVNEASESENESYSANYINGLNTYSTTENVCGTWIDGKPLYRKVIKVTSIDSANNNYDVTISISNLNEIVNIGGAIKLSGNDTYKPITVIYTDNSNAIGSSFSFNVYAITNSYISLSYGDWWKTVFDKAYIILEYTKTTD